MLFVYQSVWCCATEAAILSASVQCCGTPHVSVQVCWHRSCKRVHSTLLQVVLASGPATGNYLGAQLTQVSDVMGTIIPILVV
jgi:hypothetical protein